MILNKISRGGLPVSSCWVVTEKLAGMQNQAIGLAEALGIPYVFKEIKKPQSLWQQLFPYSHGFIPPWPDILISCGRQSVPVSVYVRKASADSTFTIHIQAPHTAPKQFDIVIVPAHDKLRGSNILVTRGAIHHVSREKLVTAAEHFRSLLAPLPRPLISVLVGGKNRHQDFSEASARDLVDNLSDAVKNIGGGLAITPSRRTGAANEEILRSHLQKSPAYIWDGQGENPYFGLLALADVIVVTSDSVSMISEACFTGKPVYVYELPGGSKRIKSFLTDLVRDGIVRPFLGKIETWTYPPFDETRRAADFVCRRFLEKMTSDQNHMRPIRKR